VSVHGSCGLASAGQPRKGFTFPALVPGSLSEFRPGEEGAPISRPRCFSTPVELQSGASLGKRRTETREPGLLGGHRSAARRYGVLPPAGPQGFGVAVEQAPSLIRVKAPWRSLFGAVASGAMPASVHRWKEGRVSTPPRMGFLGQNGRGSRQAPAGILARPVPRSRGAGSQGSLWGSW